MNKRDESKIGLDEEGVNQQDKTPRVISNASHYIKSTRCSRHNNILLNGHTKTSFLALKHTQTSLNPNNGKQTNLPVEKCCCC